MNICNWSCRDGSELRRAISLKYDTAVWSHWLKAIESWINWAVQYSDRMCPGQRSPPAQTSQEACDVHSVYELCFMKCYGKLCGGLIRCAVRPEKRLAAVRVTGIPFQGGKGTFMSSTGRIGCGAHLNVNYKGFWHVLLLLWLNYCKTLSIVWCFERNTVFRKPNRFQFSGEEILEHIKPLNAELNPICHLLALLGSHHILHVSRVRVKVRSCELLWITGGENEQNSTRSSHRKVLLLSEV